MKKIVTLITTLILVFCLFGCSKVKTSLFTASNFLDTPSNHSISSVNETLTYKVSYKQAENENTLVISIDSEKSTYTTVLTNTTYNEKACYLLETSLNIVGEIDNAGQKTALNDNITTKCYFLGVENALSPLYSERTVKSNSIVRTSAVNATTHTYEVGFYDYNVKTVYENNTAKVSLTVNEKPASDDNFVSYENHEFSNIDNKIAYVDNELLLFAPRAMTLTNATSKSFYTIDAVSVKNHKMALSSIASEPTKTIAPDNYFNGIEKVLDVLCYGVAFSIDSNASGSSIVAYYADANNKNERARMIMAETSASYGLGTYTYSIIQAKNA